MIEKNMDESNQGFMKHLGGLELKKIDDAQYEFKVEVKEIHLNTGKIAHGGFISTIADTGMGTAAHKIAGDKRCVTINLDMKFISAGMLGDKLVGKVKILKKTKTLVFISCEISNSSDIVASANGTWKILK
ncbi:PaaI family thioesterase [Pelagibacterales bacterium SAG-MED41]|nr:PaaI family thioesterase [Pelagibacterales bacterium SAG-MED41]